MKQKKEREKKQGFNIWFCFFWLSDKSAFCGKSNCSFIKKQKQTACCCDCKGQKPNNLTNKNRIKRRNSSLQNKKGRQQKSSTNQVAGNTKLEVLLTNTLVAKQNPKSNDSILLFQNTRFPTSSSCQFLQNTTTTTTNNNNSLEMSEQRVTTASLELLSRLPFTLPSALLKLKGLFLENKTHQNVVISRSSSTLTWSKNSKIY